MKRYKVIGSALALAILAGGCGKEGLRTKPAPGIQAKLAPIREAGEPVALAELDTWYATPPAGDNAATLYAEAFAALTSEDANAPDFVAKNRSALELLHQAAARRECRYATDLKAGYKASMPQISKSKLCAQLLAQEAVLNTIKGRTDLATQSVLTCLRLGRSFESEPTVISQLARTRAEQIATAGLEQALGKKVFSATELAQMQSAFEEAEKGASGTFARAFIGERCMALSLLLGSPREVSEALGTMGKSLPVSVIDAYQKSTTNAADLDYCLDRFSSLIAAARSPAPEGLDAARSWAAQVGEVRSTGYLISGLVLPGLATQLESSAARLSELREGQAAIGMERYRLAHANALPTELRALVPEYLAAVPTDPFDGKPLRYKKMSPRGYVIYGVGPDRQDDGGVERKHGDPPGANFDLVFTVRR